MAEGIKPGKVIGIFAVEIECPYCEEGSCVGANGSFMIAPEQQDEILTCNWCASPVSVPQDAFVVPQDQTRRNSSK
jgi:hypothetical protein